MTKENVIQLVKKDGKRLCSRMVSDEVLLSDRQMDMIMRWKENGHRIMSISKADSVEFWSGSQLLFIVSK